MGLPLRDVVMLFQTVVQVDSMANQSKYTSFSPASNHWRSCPSKVSDSHCDVAGAPLALQALD
ncbi:hypothetical protein IG631_11474 [Alternaria alternata]|nr:hypothetical protein IG631_11474 [Alternaria alternata]